ncbi:MAG TPA: hypothetical protein VFO36_12140 [Nitrospiraceae bacterium]|nr:hypothetical protein [Nitrospiraceae bacterium]
MLETQHNPEPLGKLPGGQVPLTLGVQLPGFGSAQEKCSALTSRHMLPPEIVALAEATSTLSDTEAFVPQLVPIKQFEKATPAAEAHEMTVPAAPVRFSVFRSFVPMCEKNGVRWSNTPSSNAAKLLTITAHR